MLPGPPREMTPMFERQVLPYLAKRADHVLRSHCIYFFGIGESTLESQLRGEMQAMKNPTLAPYAKDGEVMLRVTASAPTEAEAERLMEPVIASLRERYPQYIYGVDVDNLQTAAVRALKDAGLTAAAAESCTGGYIAKRLTDVPGSSEVFGCGAVTYANGAKERLLGVQGSTLARYGAVSPQTAREMADGVRRLSGADIGVSTTGVAGPDGGTDEKPVGLVYVGISSEWLNDVVELRLGRGFDYGEREFHPLPRLLPRARADPPGGAEPSGITDAVRTRAGRAGIGGAAGPRARTRSVRGPRSARASRRRPPLPPRSAKSSSTPSPGKGGVRHARAHRTYHPARL